MKVAILIGKTGTLFFWGAVIISLFSVFPKQAETIVGWAGVAALLIHSFEVIIFTRHFAGRLDKPEPDIVMVPVFGLFYVLPLLREAES